MYEVVDRKRTHGIVKYRVRWKGCGKNDDTWLTKHEMVNAMHCVNEYESAVDLGYPRHYMPPRLYEEVPNTTEGG